MHARLLHLARAAALGAALAGLSGLGACSAVGPDFRGLTVHHGDVPLSAKASSWTPVTLSVFQDPVLYRLVQQAQADNPTLAQARSKLLQARLTYEGTRAVQGTAVGAQATLARQRTGQGLSTAVTTSTSSADASWQLDLFGGQLRQRQELRALQASQSQTLRAARIALAAQVASAYVNVRGCERQLPVYRQTVRTQQQLTQLAQAQHAAGTVAADALQQAELALNAARQQQVLQESTCADSLHVLQSLTGLGYAQLNKELSVRQASWPVVNAPEHIQSVPAAVVLHRPDVRAAFEQARAQSAAIGVQEAQLLPSFTLAGSIGMNNASLRGTAAWTHTWSFGPSLSIPTLDPRVVLYAKREAQAAFQASAQGWRAVVRSAVLDVQNALTGLVQSRQSLRMANSSLAAQTRLVALARAEEQAGSAPAQTVLSAELSRQNAWLSRDAAQQTVLQGWISLFKATATSTY